MTKKELVELLNGYKDVKEILSILEKAGVLKITKGTDAERIVIAFQEANNTPSVRPVDLKAARLLGEKYGTEEIIQIIQIMASAQGKPYVPSINNIKTLADKWIMVGRYIKNNKPKGDQGF